MLVRGEFPWKIFHPLIKMSLVKRRLLAPLEKWFKLIDDPQKHLTPGALLRERNSKIGRKISKTL